MLNFRVAMKTTWQTPIMPITVWADCCALSGNFGIIFLIKKTLLLIDAAIKVSQMMVGEGRMHTNDAGMKTPKLYPYKQIVRTRLISGHPSCLNMK